MGGINVPLAKHGKLGKTKKRLKAVGEERIMPSLRMIGGDYVRTVGTIDRKIYACVSLDITTDKVIITDTQIKHIQERHPGDFEQYASEIQAAIEMPDYIIETNSYATAFILKTIETDGKHTRLILRLHTSHDEPEKYNSVITFQHIKEKEFQRLLKNKRILYKRRGL